MSVEGLLCEVKNFKPKHLTVALGDQLYFGGQRIYSDFKPTTSTSNNKKEGKKDGKASGKKDPLNAAINNAKNIANKALSGKGDNKCMDKVSTLEKKVESLTAELENMKVLYQQLVDKVEACAAGKVCQKVKHAVLILGDGNLSFSLSYALMNPEKFIVATVFDSKSMFNKKYNAVGTLQSLNSLSNVLVLYSVDASRLPLSWCGIFRTIIMNFPHPGGKTNIARSRVLLSSIFKRLAQIMKSSEFILRLKKVQSGVDIVKNIWSDEIPRHNKDSWKPIYLAAQEGLFLDRIEEFDPVKYQNYISGGYKETYKGFQNNTAQSLIFKKSTVLPQLSLVALKSVEGSKPCRYHSYRPFYTEDLSFLYKCNEYVIDSIVFDLITRLAGFLVVHIEEVEKLRSICPDPYLPNRIYRIVWQFVHIPLGYSDYRCIHDELRKLIVIEISSKSLPIILT